MVVCGVVRGGVQCGGAGDARQLLALDLGKGGRKGRMNDDDKESKLMKVFVRFFICFRKLSSQTKSKVRSVSIHSFRRCRWSCLLVVLLKCIRVRLS